MLAEYPIIDIDTHYAEPPDLWTSRAPAKYKDQVMHVKRRDDGRDAWFIDGREIGMIGISVIKHDLTKEHQTYTLPTFESMARASSFAPERLELMDSFGVSHQILYPNIIGFGAQALMQMSDDVALRQWHVETYNNALIDLQKAGKGRLLPQAALPLWDLDASIAELHRARKLGLSGIVMSDRPEHFGQPPLGDRAWDRFFATCQDLDLPINFHIGSGSWEGEKDKWWNSDRTTIRPDGTLEGPLVIFQSVATFLHNATDVMNLLLCGILERFPKLKFVSVESGLGWLPFVVQAVEYHWSEMMSARDHTRFKRDPRQMFAEQIFASYWFENRNSVDSFITEFGDDNLMFQTDFPHPTSLYPAVREKVEETLGHRSAETQRKVLYGNAQRVYGIG